MTTKSKRYITQVMIVNRVGKVHRTEWAQLESVATIDTLLSNFTKLAQYAYNMPKGGRIDVRVYEVIDSGGTTLRSTDSVPKAPVEHAC